MTGDWYVAICQQAICLKAIRASSKLEKIRDGFDRPEFFGRKKFIMTNTAVVEMATFDLADGVSIEDFAKVDP